MCGVQFPLLKLQGISARNTAMDIVSTIIFTPILTQFIAKRVRKKQKAGHASPADISK